MVIFDSSRFFNIVVENTKISLEYILQTTRDILQRISIDVVDTTHWAKIPQKVKALSSTTFEIFSNRVVPKETSFKVKHLDFAMQVIRVLYVFYF